jgi:hypothetical protein
MKVEIDITSITVMESETTMDTILLNTSLPSAVHPYNKNLSLSLYAASGTGSAYVDKHFPSVDVITIVKI